MRERDINRKMFHKGHHEVIAKQFREQLEPIMEAQRFYRTDDDDSVDTRIEYGRQLEKCMLQSTTLVNLAIELAKRFTLDNDDFDPCIWLDRCSPDEELYPLSELWPGVDKQELIDA